VPPDKVVGCLRMPRCLCGAPPPPHASVPATPTCSSHIPSPSSPFHLHRAPHAQASIMEDVMSSFGGPSPPSDRPTSAATDTPKPAAP
jgi:hypothetical protein